MKLSDLKFEALSKKVNSENFDCDDADINEFLKMDSFNYKKQMLANTFVFVDDENKAVAYFCISTDSIVDLGEAEGYGKRGMMRINSKSQIPNEKWRKQYPAIKVGRLGVDKKYQGTGLAYDLMDFIKVFTLEELRPACRFLLLDAYNKEKQINYYQKNGFDFLIKTDKEKENRIMFFDILKLKNLS